MTDYLLPKDLIPSGEVKIYTDKELLSSFVGQIIASKKAYIKKQIEREKGAMIARLKTTEPDQAKRLQDEIEFDVLCTEQRAILGALRKSALSINELYLTCSDMTLLMYTLEVLELFGFVSYDFVKGVYRVSN